MISFDILEAQLHTIKNIIWSWPIVIFIVTASILFSLAFNWAQIRYFTRAWKLILSKENSEKTENSISSLQAFINALSASLGNGGLAGMATVLVDGGPGTMFWIFILGIFSMILRFTEVYASTLPDLADEKNNTGPFVYIKKMPFGSLMVFIYSFCMLAYILVAGDAMQCNSMGLALQQVTGWNAYAVGSFFALIVFYITAGGAKRIMKASEAIIPVKVVLFFSLIIAVIIHHAAHLPEALRIILDHAFTVSSCGKGILAFTLQQAITVGFSRALNATEAGVGTAGIFFASTKTKQPLKSAIMSIVTAFISTNLVCASLILCLVSSGVWNSGMTSTPLVIAGFATTFGSWAAPIITFLTFSFGFGVLVAYSFLGSELWHLIFGKTTQWLYIILFSFIAFAGTISQVKIVWTSIDIIVAMLIVINVSALLWNLPLLRKCLIRDEKKLKNI